MPIAADYLTINVHQQNLDPASMLTFYRRLIKLRQTEPVLQVGDYIPVGVMQNILAYIRAKDDRRFLIVLNLSHAPGLFEIEHQNLCGKVVFSTHPMREEQQIASRIFLESDEGIVVLLDN